MDNSAKKLEEKKQLRKKALSLIRRDKLIRVGLLLSLFIIVLFGSLLIYLNSREMKDSDSPMLRAAYELNYRFFPKEKVVSVIVNQEPIYAEEIEKRYNIIPEEYRQFITKEDLIQQLVDEKILLQKAASENIAVTDEEVDLYIQNLSAQAGTTIEEFEQLLASNGLTLEDAKAFYKKSLILNQLLQNEVFSEIVISDDDIESYYNDNVAFFTTPESLNVSHILICHNSSVRCVSNLTKEEAKVKAEEVLKLAKSGDFSELAMQYSNEPAAIITKGSLGLVNKDSPLDETFLTAALSLKPGEVSEPVETVFGYHIIKAFSQTKEEVTKLDAVKDQIYQTLFAEVQTGKLMEYISGLRNESQISYLNN